MIVEQQHLGAVEPLWYAHFTTAQSARVYDLFLDGIEYYPCDRRAALDIYGAAEWAKTAAIINRGFTHVSVGTSLAHGIRQFLDLGCGVPAMPNVHEITAATQPGCPVVYVDHDPAVHQHTRRHQDGGDPHQVSAVHADLLHMERLLARPEVAAAFDLDEPVAVLVHDVLPWCEDDQAVRQAMATLRAWLPRGSTLSITHLTDHWHRATMPDLIDACAQHGLRVRPRCREEIAELFGDFVQQGPGLVATGQWYAGSWCSQYPQEQSAAFAGIGVKPARTSTGRAPRGEPAVSIRTDRSQFDGRPPAFRDAVANSTPRANGPVPPNGFDAPYERIRARLPLVDQATKP
ncbi:SAM-dependent methyltransferase [Streptomyces iconiensis]|uniref:SAM-dependent methyltransferase n=1 Tax=Streptomyces iconiensis TaxID=1384038 RepID=A0ABT7A4K4_9ACTN|nr:SAM-dependent methyltransferase [Streptomyces iconiensis]MDJ1136282.1 SAM-dependent methyltransferase [Streptomyces iconiensis]